MAKNDPPTPKVPPGHNQTNLQIDRVHYRVDTESLTGQELRNLVSPPVPDSRDLFLVVPGGEDLPIGNTQTVALHDGMRFFTVPGRINPGSSEEIPHGSAR